MTRRRPWYQPSELATEGVFVQDGRLTLHTVLRPPTAAADAASAADATWHPNVRISATRARPRCPKHRAAGGTVGPHSALPGFSLLLPFVSPLMPLRALMKPLVTGTNQMIDNTKSSNVTQGYTYRSMNDERSQVPGKSWMSLYQW
eukprot:CAMPEP_0203912530 /NCGR_PEP_ID=MMETSP0359-20131031/53602_1 /ASSEMBLY_ACC=CAM_ASM_000338 /TAXON_ID=268821 /ORGANISM="Scrippsiella Hangoei, Strain SHTV-5" /LENGTH=145 /DNA_ID=CAMNT_0050838485 /DNA_START=48 /DNA_END=486 /DNA_ORIENTATION=-